jgi:hypothetical protein
MVLLEAAIPRLAAAAEVMAVPLQVVAATADLRAADLLRAVAATADLRAADLPAAMAVAPLRAADLRAVASADLRRRALAPRAASPRRAAR